MRLYAYVSVHLCVCLRLLFVCLIECVYVWVAVCVTVFVSAGRPPPQLTWTLDGRRVDGAVSSVSGDGTVRSELALPAVSRRHLGAELRCAAANSALTGGRWAAVRLELLLAPLAVQLADLPAAVSAGSVHQFTCSAVGGRPAAHIGWTVDGVPVSSGTVQKVSGLLRHCPEGEPSPPAPPRR